LTPIMPHASCLTRHKESGEQAFGLDLEWASWVLVDVHGAVSTGSTMHEPVSGWRPRPVEVRDAGSGHSPDR